MEESISVDKINCKLIKEGKTSIYQPDTVFYNPAQEFNRDLSVLVLDTFLEHELWKRSKKARKLQGRELNVLDALSASGLRGIRYANELVNLNKINKIHINDINSNAISVMKHNVKFNELEDRISIENMDANFLMYKSRYEEKQYLCVDLDPYGSAGLFLDALVQSTHDGGLLMVTATDVAILCGNAPESCYAKYGSISLKGNFCHEFALRILLRSIDQAALKYGRYIVPLLSLSIDFYVRVFVQIFTGPNEAKKSANKTSMVYSCVGCNYFTLLDFCTHNVNKKSKNELTSIKYSLSVGPPVDRRCPNCDSTFRVSGPIWNKRIHDYEFVEMLKTNLNRSTNDEIGKQRFNTYRRLKGMMYMVSEELPDIPLFYSIGEMRPSLRISLISQSDFRSAILNAGYKVSNSHTNPDSIKTTAPNSVFWDIIVTWLRMKSENGEDKISQVNQNESKQDEVNNDKINQIEVDKDDQDETISKIDQTKIDYTRNEINLNEESKDDRSNKRRTPAEIICNRKIETQISFEYNPEEMTESRRLQLLRYQVNPAKFWGPGTIPSAKAPTDKRALNQNKRKRKLEVDSF